MYDFSNEGFFGYAEKGNFQYWSIWHFLPILILIGAIIFVAMNRKKIAEWKYEGRLRFIMAFVAIIVEMSYFWRLLYVGSGNSEELTLMTKLPLQLCEWGCILSAFMLMSKNRTLCCICYYICLTFTVIPLITPAVISTTGPTFYRYYQFWGEHCLPIFFVFYMVFVHGFRPKFKDMLKTLILLIPITVLSIIANYQIPHANYLYLAGSTDGNSIANILPQNIWLRLGLYAIVGFTLFVLVYLPIYFTEKKKNAKIHE